MNNNLLYDNVNHVIYCQGLILLYIQLLPNSMSYTIHVMNHNNIRPSNVYKRGTSKYILMELFRNSMTQMGGDVIIYIIYTSQYVIKFLT